MTKVEVNYLDKIKEDKMREYVAYNEIFHLLMRLIQMMTIDQENGCKHSEYGFSTYSKGGLYYSVDKVDNSLTITRCKPESMSDKSLKIHFNLWPIDAIENAQYGRVNIRCELNEHSSIIFSKSFDWIKDLRAARSLQECDLEEIKPVFEIEGKEYSGMLPFLQEIDSARKPLVISQIQKCMFDRNELAYLVAEAADHFAEYGKKNNSPDRRIRKFIGLFSNGKR